MQHQVVNYMLSKCHDVNLAKLGHFPSYPITATTKRK